MKSRVNMRESFERKIECDGSKKIRLARSLALATAMTLLLQPLTMTAFAKDQTESKTPSRFGNIFSKGHNDVRSSKVLIVEKDEDSDDEDDQKKADPKKDVKKDSDKKDAKEAAKQAAAEKKAQEKAKKDAAKNSEKAAKVEEAKEKAKTQAKAKSDAAAKAAKKVEKVEPKKVDEKATKVKSTAGDADKTAKKKKGWFNRPKGANDDDEIIIVEEEVVEVAKPTTKNSVEAKPAAGAVKTTIVTPVAKPAAASVKPAVGTTVSAGQATTAEVVGTEKPVLLPDNALVSVLQDISKSLGEANEGSGVETEDDKIIVGLARQVLDRSLGSGELKDNRILAPEHSNTAKNTMTTEAWASGDVIISDKLRGSVATVWGKRINGMLHVTIAGECQNKTLSNGEKVGDFIVVVKGRSPVKSGFDIQSQADVTYWIGAIDSVSVEAACSRLKEKAAEGEAEPSSSTKPVDIKGDVKKKSPVVLESVLTRRGLQYLRAMTLYQEQQRILAQQLEKEAVVEQAVATTTDTSPGASGDEVKTAGYRTADDEVDGEQIAQRTRSTEQNGTHGVKRVRSSDEGQDVDDGDRVVRRTGTSDDDGEDDERVARNTRLSADDETPTNKRNGSDKDDDQKSARASNNKGDKDKVADRSSDGKGGDDKTIRRSLDKNDDQKIASPSLNKGNNGTVASTDKTSNNKVSSRPSSSIADSDDDRRQGSSVGDADGKRVSSNSKNTNDDDSAGRSIDASDKHVAEPNTTAKTSINTVQTASVAKAKTDTDDTSKLSKNPWTGKPNAVDNNNKVDSAANSKSSAISDPDSPSSKWPSTTSTSTNTSATASNTGATSNTNPITAKSDPAWKDDWSRDGGNPNLMTNQTSSLPNTTGSTPASTPSLTRISMLTPAPATASSRAWESPALNLAPRSPSLEAALIYPERAIAGQFLTVSVLAKDKQPERSVELSFNGATISTDLNGQALYMIPEDMPPGQTLHISLAERPEVSSKVVDVLQRLDDGSAQRTPRIDKVSPFVAADGVLVINGHEFDGLADKNRILIDNGVDANVIAASPVQLRVLIPGKIQPGTHTVTITDANLRSSPAKFEFIKAEVEQPDARKTKGTLDRIVVRIHGTRQPVPVRVVNRTPDVIKVSRGDNLLITTPGGTDNSSVLGVKQLKKGDYKVEASIEI